jgi:hypothetical protein
MMSWPSELQLSGLKSHQDFQSSEANLWSTAVAVRENSIHTLFSPFYCSLLRFRVQYRNANAHYKFSQAYLLRKVFSNFFPKEDCICCIIFIQYMLALEY